MHPDDKIPLNSTLEIKPIELRLNSTQLIERNMTITDDNYLVVAKLTDKSGDLIGELNNKLWFNITSLRLTISNPGDKWILIREFGIV